MPARRAARFVVTGLLLIATAGDRRFDLPAQTASTVIIDGNQQYQTIDGFGVNANVNSWNNGELTPALDLLVDQLGATIWRVVIDNADWEATNDDLDDKNFNWTFYDDVYTSPKFEELWSTISYLNQKGVSNGLMLNFMGPVPSWMGGSQINFAAEDEWVEMIASLVYYARITRGLEFALVSPMNEPDHDGIEGPKVDQWQYVRLMRKLAQRLDEIGLADIRLTGPDTAFIDGGVGNYMPEMMTDSLLMAKVDHFGFHNYAGDSGGAGAAIESSAYPTRNFWITEVTNIWDILAHLDQGPSATIVWDAYDSVYNHAILAGRGTTPPNDVGNGPPLLAYDTSTGIYTPRKGFYECAQLFRFVSPGSRRIGASVLGSGLTILAFRDDSRGRLTIVGRNTSSEGQTLNGALSGLPAVGTLELYQTTPSANLQQRPNVPVSSGSFSVQIAGNSTFTLTTPTATDAEPPTVSITEPTDGAVISGTVAVSASASDNLGVAGVRFLLDGISGLEDTAPPYSVQWDTTTVLNGTHVVTARARDTAGNVTTSAPVTVTVSNSVDTTPPIVIATMPANGDASASVTTKVAATFSEPMNPATITTTTVTLRDGNTIVNASVNYAVATATLTPSQALAHGVTYTATVKGGATGVRDLAGNALPTDVSWSFTTRIGDECPCTIWGPSTTGGPPIEDGNAVELGMKFRADRNGSIDGLRFYKHPQNTGTHIGNFWTTDGTLLGTVTFTSETTSGWQHATFASPIAIQGNTTYVASYHTTAGFYAATIGGLSSGVDRGPLHALPDAPGDGNGVYQYGTAGTFPDQTYQATNYWIDVVFRTDIGTDTLPPAVTLTAPANGSTLAGKVTVTAVASDDVGVAGVQFLLDGAPLGSEDLNAPYAVSWDTLGTANGSHTISARARDGSGHETAAADVKVTVRNDTSAPEVTLTTPTNGATVSGPAVSIAAIATDDVEVAGVQFLVDGAALHVEDTTAPYMVSWNTTVTTDGLHTVTAIARDGVGNRTTASAITVTVRNGGPPAGTGGLISSYSFDAGSGNTITDDSGNGHNGVISGATWSAAGRFGSAMAFDGDDWVTVADAAALDLTTAMTVEAWIKPTEIDSWRTVMIKEGAGELAYALYANSEAPQPGIWVRTGSTTNFARGPHQLTLNTWTHLAATYDGSLLRLYLNGLQVGAEVVTGPINVTGGPLRFGGNSIWNEYFAGLIDEVRLYNRVLSAGEIQIDSMTPIAADVSSPTIAITDPPVGASVSGTITVSADAVDNVSVAGVQFLLDGTPLGSEDLTAPYSVLWETRGTANGPHALSARARDAAGNQNTASPVTVTVSNTGPSSVPSGLVAAYGFEEGNGTTTADASGYGHTGTLSGATWTTAGRFGSALSFDGTNDLVTLSDTAALSLTIGMTLEAWVRPATVQNWRTVVLKEDSSGLSYGLYSSNDVSRPNAHIRTRSDIGVAASSPLPTDTWSHLAVTYDGITLRFYVNGIEVARRSELGVILTSSNPVRLGGNLVWGEYFQGEIDEVRIYNRALSEDEIQAAMSAPVASGS